jgi:hypothetical protein
LKDPGVDGRIILEWIFDMFDGGAWTVLIWLRIGTLASKYQRARSTFHALASAT